MSDRTDTSCNDASRSDERVTTLEEAIESGWSAWSDTAESVKHRESMRLEWQAYRAALASLAADAAETQKLRERVEALERELNRAGFVLGISGDRRESIEYVLDKTVAERDAAVADRDRLANALDLIGHGWDGDEFNDPADLMEKYASIALAALAGREGSDA